MQNIFLHSQDDNLRPPLVEVSDPKKILISDIMIPMPIISLLVQDILIILLLQNSKTAKLVIKARVCPMCKIYFSPDTRSILHGQWAIFNAHDGVTTKANAIFDTWTYCGILCGGILPLLPPKLSIGSVASLWWLNSMDGGCGEKKINKQ